MKKKGVVAAVLVLFLCVAVYLNWNTGEIESDSSRVKTTLGEVSEDSDVTEEKVENTNEYFEEARLEKKKARDSAISTLQESVDEENFSEEARARAAESIETISTGAISETRIETLIKAKGFEDCIALRNEKGVNIIVTAPKEGLTSSDISKIKDITVAETGISPSEIKIIEIK